MKTFIYTCLLFVQFGIVAQQMNPGFQLLEQGDFEAAETFFGEILQEYPTNKTALICFGRAQGLNGAPQEAQQLFSDLLITYPGDLEVQLNYAESLLWSSDFQKAKAYYSSLLETASTNFSVQLGLANTLSNLKEYPDALIHTNLALEIKPLDPSALNSRKYIRLGYASQYLQLNNLETAIQLLDDNLTDFPSDEITLQNKANAYQLVKQWDQAKEVYKEFKNPVLSGMGLALVAHEKGSETRAMEFAANARTLSHESQYEALQGRASQRYIEALLWNRKFSEAKKEITLLEETEPQLANLLWATYGMYTAKLQLSKSNYLKILQKDSTSFNGNLGLANLFRAQGQKDSAYYYAQKTLQFYPNQKDAMALQETLKLELAPTVRTGVSYTTDNGSNNAVIGTIGAVLPVSTRMNVTFNYTQRHAENELSGDKARNSHMSLGMDYRLINNTWLRSQVGFVKAEAVSQNYTDVNGSIYLESRPFPLQTLKIGYQRELQSFNAELIDEKIFMNHFSLNYNMGTNFGLGWYTQLMYTPQTDGNARSLLFTSLYYNLKKIPFIKAGVNYQYLSFKNQMSMLYFSPKKYQTAEVFVDVNTNQGKWNLSVQLAGGYQFVERNEGTTLFRAAVNVNYAVSNRLSFGAYGKYTNNASETATGFKFFETGLQCTLKLGSGPIFKLK
jgi:tetratricopeptide (TPR) repeat protein